MQKNKFSIWLRPTQNQIDDFTYIISKLSHQHGTIPFPPHITLQSAIDIDLDSIIDTCIILTKQYKKFSIPLLEVGFTESYFRNLYIKAEISKILQTLYEDFNKILKLEPKEDFLPHVSLLYGNIEISSKRKIKEKLDQIMPRSFHCQRLDIYETNGKTHNWHLIQTFYFA